MKKYNVFKVLLIALAAAIVLSFLIPQSTIGYSGIEKGKINPITLVDSISNGLTSFSVFIASFVYILSIGIFYAVLKKSEKYDAVINNTAAKFKSKKTFVIISVLTFGIMTACIGDIMPMLIFAPAFIDIAKKMGYDSKASILMTVGAIILGSAGSLYTNYPNQILATKVTTNIIAKIILLVISLAALIVFLILTSKVKDTKLKKENVKKSLPVSIIFDVLLVLIILGTVPWNGYFGFTGFTDVFASITDFKVFKISLFNALVGQTLLAFGEWTIYSLIVLLSVSSVVMALIYKIKFDDLIATVANGVKKAFPYALILVFANVVLVSVYNSGFYTTVITSIGGMKDSILSSSTVSALSSVAYPDYTYASQFTLSTLASTITKNAIYPAMALIFQSIYSLVLLISPTSILVLLALRYENVSYKEWIKYVFKFFLALLVAYLVIIIIVGSKFVKPTTFVVLGVLVVIFILFLVLSLTKKEEKKETKKTKKK